ncbi:MAG: hypothetical protein KGL39_48965 [Patescibacteria group bacterium]|nr:hypothetical protein [Patescibacteria group bacterium]
MADAAEELQAKLAEAVHGMYCVGPCNTGPDAWDRRVAEAMMPAVAPFVAEVEALRQEVGQYRDAITWDTSCLNCSKLLDRCYEADMRAEQAAEKAEALAARISALCSEVVANCAPRGCSCAGHTTPGVSHITPCCDVPHVEGGPR